MQNQSQIILLFIQVHLNMNTKKNCWFAGLSIPHKSKFWMNLTTSFYFPILLQVLLYLRGWWVAIKVVYRKLWVRGLSDVSAAENNVSAEYKALHKKTHNIAQENTQHYLVNTKKGGGTMVTRTTAKEATADDVSPYQ